MKDGAGDEDGTIWFVYAYMHPFSQRYYVCGMILIDSLDMLMEYLNLNVPRWQNKEFYTKYKKEDENMASWYTRKVVEWTIRVI